MEGLRRVGGDSFTAHAELASIATNDEGSKS